MLHKHPPSHEPFYRYCQQEKAGTRLCCFHYPQPLQVETMVDDCGKVHYRCRKCGDDMVVPYCMPLLCTYQCHINFEVASATQLFQYIFKYIHKGDHLLLLLFPLSFSLLGPDGARVQIRDSNTPVDEIDDFWQARYLSAGEAAWRILSFHLTTKDPAISALPVDTLHSIHHTQYSCRRSTSSTMSKLDRYFFRPQGIFFDEAHVPMSFEDLTYAEYFQWFHLQKLALHKPNPSQQPIMSVVQQGSKNHHVSRIQPISPSQGEHFYIRALLLTKCTRSFDDLHTVDGAIKSLFQDAAKQSGLFLNECEDVFALREAVSLLYTPK